MISQSATLVVPSANAGNKLNDLFDVCIRQGGRRGLPPRAPLCRLRQPWAEVYNNASSLACLFFILASRTSSQ